MLERSNSHYPIEPISVLEILISSLSKSIKPFDSMRNRWPSIAHQKLWPSCVKPKSWRRNLKRRHISTRSLVKRHEKKETRFSKRTTGPVLSHNTLKLSSETSRTISLILTVLHATLSLWPWTKHWRMPKSVLKLNLHSVSPGKIWT